MKRTTFYPWAFFAILLALALQLTGCSSQASQGATLAAADRDAVLAYTEPLADPVLLALNSGDYAAFSANMNEKMKAALTEDAFKKLRQQLSDSIGEYKGRSVDRVVDYGELVTVYYKTEFSKRSGTMNLSFTKSEPHLISGMYFQ